MPEERQALCLSDWCRLSASRSVAGLFAAITVVLLVPSLSYARNDEADSVRKLKCTSTSVAKEVRPVIEAPVIASAKSESRIAEVNANDLQLSERECTSRQMGRTEAQCRASESLEDSASRCLRTASSASTMRPVLTDKDKTLNDNDSEPAE
jgi:hypothetical protein